MIAQSTVTYNEIGEWVRRTQATHAATLAAFHLAAYHAPHTWPVNSWVGVPVLKAATDLWMYQEIIARTKPALIIETGTAKGGSALFFAHVLDALGAPASSQIITVDVEPVTVGHPRVQCLTGSSVDPALVASIQARAREASGPVLVSLDSDHSEAHVYEELTAYAGLVTVGSWCVVEDTNTGGHPVWLAHQDEGPAGAVRDFLLRQSDFTPDPVCERHLYSNNPGGWLRRIA